MTVPEAAQYLGIGKTRMWQLVWSNAVPVLRLGDKTVRIPRRELDEWVRSRTAQPAAI